MGWSASRWRRRLDRLRRALGLEAPPLRRPLFLLGTVRSGTTYLGDVLGAHPQVALCGFELLAEWYELGRVCMAGPGVPCLRCDGLTDADAEPRRVTALRRGFADLHARKGGRSSQRFLNKNPHLWNKIDFLLQVFPDAQLLVTRRPLEATVASTLKLWDKMYADWGVVHALPEAEASCWSCGPRHLLEDIPPERLFPGGHVAVLAEYWLRTYREICRHRQHIAPGGWIDFGAFVAEPEETWRRLQAALALRPARLRLPAPLLPNRDERWKTLLSAADVAALEAFRAAHHHDISLVDQCFGVA